MHWWHSHYTWILNCWSKTLQFTGGIWHTAPMIYIGVGAGNCLGCKRYFAPKAFLPTLSVAVGRLHFPLQCCHKLENKIFGTWNLVLNKPTKKCSRLWRTLSEASWLSILEHLPHSSEVLHSHSNCCCRKGTSDLPEVGLKLLPSLKAYMWHVSYYLFWLCRESHNIICSTEHIYMQ